ncbi:hypothetical protein ACFSTC_04705 [Nonomuraea ferruginea]
MLGWLGLMLLADLAVAAGGLGGGLQWLVFVAGNAGIAAVILRRRHRVETYGIMLCLSFAVSVLMGGDRDLRRAGGGGDGRAAHPDAGRAPPRRAGQGRGDARRRRADRAHGRVHRPGVHHGIARLLVHAVRRLVDDRGRRRLPPLPAGAPQGGRALRTARRTAGAGQGTA